MIPFIQIRITEHPGGFRALLYDTANNRGRLLIARTLTRLHDRIELELAAYKP